MLRLFFIDGCAAQRGGDGAAGRQTGCGSVGFGMGGCGVGFSTRGGGLRRSLRFQLLETNLFGGTMTHLGPVLAAIGGKISVLGTLQVRPGIKNRDILGRLARWRPVDPFLSLRLHDASFLRFP